MHKGNLIVDCVLFDLDGTLADTSRDMCDSLNRVLESRNLAQVDCMSLKKYISRGAIGIIEYASIVNGKSIDSSMLRSEFLDDYKNNCFIKTKLNENMSALLKYLLDKQIKIGIVTNKHSRYVNKIIEGLGIKKDLSCIVTGDMVLNAKPACDSLMKAVEIVQTSIENTIYMGDDERDIIAGKKAGMITVAANFGFISDETNINSWEADIIIDDPMSLKKYLVNKN
tara:strand:- start:5760 stop:6437 length:678 start_codon:yes stop_codon:yes gene_type:complete